MNPPKEENFRISMPSAKGKGSGGVNVVSNTFPDGLRVLIVDDDSTCLLVLTKMLQNCHYNVTQCLRAKDALSILYEGRSKFDIVISDVHMPDMDGFRLLEIISLEMDLPVVMMSADDKKDVVMRVIIQGACDYLMKPVRKETIQFLWQHVVRKQKIGLKSLVQLKNLEHGEVNLSQSNDNQHTSLGNKENCESSNGQKDQVDEQAKDRDNTASLKKPRTVWSSDLHEKFVAAVNQIGFKNAVPKKILELMNEKGLTRENVASHLQKYRLYCRRNKESLQYGSKFSLPEGHSQELMLNITSLDSCNLQSLATSSELPQQSLTILRADIERSNAVCVGQRKFYNYGMEESMPEMEQQSSSYGRGVNLAQEIPTMIQSEQLMPSIRSVEDLGNKNVQTKDGFSNNNAYGNDGLSLVTQNPFKLRRLNGTAGEEDYSCGVTCYPFSLPSTLIDFPNARVTNLSEHGFSLESSTPASFMSDRNQEYYNLDSSYEPILGIERFAQDGLHIRPLDEHCVGRIEAESIFDGYPTNNSCM